MIRLRQSTASQEIPLGHFVDDTDGKTAETALTIANTDIKVWKNGATTLANKNSGGATHISGGIYYATLDATDTDTIGPLVLFVAVSGALAVRLECEVLDEAMYDHLFGTNPPLSPTVAGRTLDVSAGGEAGVDWANVGSPTTTVGLSGTTIKTATDVETDTADIQGRLPAALVSGRIDASVGAMATGVLTATAIAADAITAAKVASDVTTELQSGLATASALAAVQTDIDDIQTRIPAALVSGRMDSSVGAMATGVLTATAIAADAITAAKVAADVTTEIQSGLATAASLATAQSSLDSHTSTLSTISGYLDTEVAAILAAVDTEVAAIKAKTDNLPASPAATGDIPTAAAVADAVWDEAMSGHLTSGTTGNALNAAGSAGDPWSTALPGAYGAGTAGKIVGDNINATISSRASQTSVDTVDDFLDTEIATIVAAVADIQSRLPAALVSGRMDASVGAMASAVLTAAALATDAGNKIADQTLRRSLATALASANGDSKTFRSLAGAIAKLVNKVSISGSTLTVTETDDATSLGTQAVTTDANANPITAVDTN